MKKQPAKINYFFKDGYVDFWRVIKSIFSRCFSVIADSWEEVSLNGSFFIEGVKSLPSGFFDALKHLFLMMFYLCKVILCTVFATPICLVLSIFQGVFLCVIMLLFYILFLMVLFVDFVYRSFKRISTSCPNCQEKFALPTFVCTCGAHHTKLSPSKYGAFTRRCECGRKLKTTFLNGRHKQEGKWICPKCGYELGTVLQVDIPIPVVGGPSSGKTCFINMAIAQLEKNADKNGLVFEYKSNHALGDDYQDNKFNMQNGRLPVKTNDKRMKYYQFYLTPKKKKVRNLVSLCDVAGETFDDSLSIGSQIGYKHANSFLMLVDPLSLKKYREEVYDKINLSSYRASERGMDEVLDTLINTLQNMNCLNSKNMIKTVVAVVFTKCDIPGLDDKIGDNAVKRYMATNNIKSKYVAKNKVCEKFLIDYEEENFLNSLKSKFKNIQFFTCSALGHIDDGSLFKPNGVEEPALWLIDKASYSLNLKSITTNT